VTLDYFFHQKNTIKYVSQSPRKNFNHCLAQIDFPRSKSNQRK